MPKQWILKPIEPLDSIWRRFSTDPITVTADDAEAARKKAAKERPPLKRAADSKKTKDTPIPPWENEDLTSCEPAPTLS